MAGRGRKAAPAKKKANGYKMPPPMPPGEVITDTIAKRKWRIGPSIGVGGFGEIYSACDDNNAPKKDAQYPYVVKIEPHENGPLFVEKHFYLRNANKDDISKFMKESGLKSLGMPTYHGSSSHMYRGEMYRYLVLERYGRDLWSIFTESGRQFPTHTVFQLGVQIIDVLEYIHSKGYVHADIKGANILLGLKKGTENQAFLVDFGLATRVADKEFKPDPKCAHNGTMEYTSRDAHVGAPTMRGDLEILGYNMLQWIVGELPWEKALQQPKTVQSMKESFMKSVRSSIAKYLPPVPEALINFFEYINTLKPKEMPSYTKCRQLFESYLKSQGVSRIEKLEFKSGKKGIKNVTNDEPAEVEDAENVKAKKRTTKRKPVNSYTSHEEDVEKEAKTKPKTKRKPVKRAKVVTANSAASNGEDANSGVANEEETSNAEDADSAIDATKKSTKRRSLEPVFATKVKKLKLTPKFTKTPPNKRNHVNIATQTSVEVVRKSPRGVTFDSPVSINMSSSKLSKDPNAADQNSSLNSSRDIFEDSFTDVGQSKRKKELIAEEVITVKRVMKKKVTTAKPKGRSWRDSPAVVNGRGPVV